MSLVEHSSKSNEKVGGQSEYNALDVLGDVNEGVDLVAALTKEEIASECH